MNASLGPAPASDFAVSCAFSLRRRFCDSTRPFAHFPTASEPAMTEPGGLAETPGLWGLAGAPQPRTGAFCSSDVGGRPLLCCIASSCHKQICKCARDPRPSPQGTRGQLLNDVSLYPGRLPRVLRMRVPWDDGEPSTQCPLRHRGCHYPWWWGRAVLGFSLPQPPLSPPKRAWGHRTSLSVEAVASLHLLKGDARG